MNPEYINDAEIQRSYLHSNTPLTFVDSNIDNGIHSQLVNMMPLASRYSLGDVSHSYTPPASTAVDTTTYSTIQEGSPSGHLCYVSSDSDSQVMYKHPCDTSADYIKLDDTIEFSQDTDIRLASRLFRDYLRNSGLADISDPDNQRIITVADSLIYKLTKTSGRLKSRVNSLSDHVTRQNKQIQEKNHALSKQNQELELLRIDAAQMKQNLQLLKNSATSQEIAELRHKNYATSKEIAELKHIINDLNAENSRLLSLLDSLSCNLSSITDAARSSAQQLSSLGYNLESLTSAVRCARTNN